MLEEITNKLKEMSNPDIPSLSVWLSNEIASTEDNKIKGAFNDLDKTSVELLDIIKDNNGAVTLVEDMLTEAISGELNLKTSIKAMFSSRKVIGETLSNFKQEHIAKGYTTNSVEDYLRNEVYDDFYGNGVTKNEVLPYDDLDTNIDITVEKVKVEGSEYHNISTIMVDTMELLDKANFKVLDDIFIKNKAGTYNLIMDDVYESSLDTYVDTEADVITKDILKVLDKLNNANKLAPVLLSYYTSIDIHLASLLSSNVGRWDCTLTTYITGSNEGVCISCNNEGLITPYQQSLIDMYDAALKQKSNEDVSNTFIVKTCPICGGDSFLGCLYNQDTKVCTYTSKNTSLVNSELVAEYENILCEDVSFLVEEADPSKVVNTPFGIKTKGIIDEYKKQLREGLPYLTVQMVDELADRLPNLILTGCLIYGLN